MQLPPAPQKRINRRFLVILLLCLALVGVACNGKTGSSSHGSSGNSGGSNSDTRSEAPHYPPLSKGSLDLAIYDAQKGCSRLPKGVERLYYCLEVASGIYDKGSAKAPSGKVKSTGIYNNPNCRAAYANLRGRGFSHAQASGFAGNFYAESGCDPADPNPAASGGGCCIAQWEGGRYNGSNGLRQYAGNNLYDLGTQMNFVWWELHHTQSSALGPIKATDSPQEAASVIMKKYERPFPGPTAHEDRRRRFAQDMFNHTS